MEQKCQICAYTTRPKCSLLSPDFIKFIGSREKLFAFRQNLTHLPLYTANSYHRCAERLVNRIK